MSLGQHDMPLTAVSLSRRLPENSSKRRESGERINNTPTPRTPITRTFKKKNPGSLKMPTAHFLFSVAPHSILCTVGPAHPSHTSSPNHTTTHTKPPQVYSSLSLFSSSHTPFASSQFAINMKTSFSTAAGFVIGAGLLSATAQASGVVTAQVQIEATATREDVL